TLRPALSRHLPVMALEPACHRPAPASLPAMAGRRSWPRLTGREELLSTHVGMSLSSTPETAEFVESTIRRELSLPLQAMEFRVFQAMPVPQPPPASGNSRQVLALTRTAIFISPMAMPVFERSILLRG